MCWIFFSLIIVQTCSDRQSARWQVSDKTKISHFSPALIWMQHHFLFFFAKTLRPLLLVLLCSTVYCLMSKHSLEMNDCCSVCLWMSQPLSVRFIGVVTVAAEAGPWKRFPLLVVCLISAEDSKCWRQAVSDVSGSGLLVLLAGKLWIDTGGLYSSLIKLFHSATKGQWNCV